MRSIDKIIVHCADTPPTMDIGAKEIRKWHVQGNGWADIGYHFVIRRNGNVENGRDLDLDGDVFEEIGAHTAGYNENSIGICLAGGKTVAGEGGKPDCNFTLAQYESLRNLIENILSAHPSCTLHGHRDFSSKACPCFDVRAFYGQT